MRVFRDEKLRHKLLLAHKPKEIIQIFENGETGREDDQ
jgi:mannitol/fructose-specific phosphotransferase system IIA component (Ntr-type)